MQSTKAHKGAMAAAENAQKPEFKVRTFPKQERQDQRDVSRVFLTAEVFMDFKLVNGQICRLWKSDDPDGPKRAGIAWTASQKPLNYNNIQMFKTFHTACGYTTDDKLCIAPGGPVPAVDTVKIRDTTHESQTAEERLDLSEEDRPHWEWYLKESLGILHTSHKSCPHLTVQRADLIRACREHFPRYAAQRCVFERPQAFLRSRVH
jgi:AAA family ATPase